MGLTIHYSLKLDVNCAETAREKVRALHKMALDLPFAEISQLVEFQGEDCRLDRKKRDDPYAWIKVQASQFVDYENCCFGVNAQQAIAFSAWPGEGCELATFGLAVFPKMVELPPRVKRNLNQRDEAKLIPQFIPSNLPPWSWSSFCKTQYASNPEYGGFEHFLQCHNLVIQMLDAAQELGILTEVSDEGHYWENRDIQALKESVSEYNALVAAVVGGLGTILTDAGVEVKAYAPITKYPNFEYLEAEGQQQIDQKDHQS